MKLYSFIFFLYHRTDPRVNLRHIKVIIVIASKLLVRAHLGELEACVASDCITKLITQSAFLLIIWQPAKDEKKVIRRCFMNGCELVKVFALSSVALTHRKQVSITSRG